MKKTLFILPLLAGLALTTGCDLFKKKTDDDAWIVVPEIEGGTAAEKQAILEAVNNLSVCVRKGGTDLFPTAKNINLSGTEQDYIRVLNKVNSGGKTVELTWDFKTSQSTFDAKVKVDDNADLVYIKYPAAGAADQTFEWSLTKIVCGSAVSTKTNSDYTATVKAPMYDFVPMTIAQINAVTENAEPQSFTVDGKTYTYASTSDIINYEAKNSSNKYSPWWKTGRAADAEDNYIFTTVRGKIIYLSDDGNWGLLADGDNVIEIYSGSELDLNSTAYPEINSDYVEVKGEVSHYYGNFQMSFIKSIRKYEGSVTAPTMSYPTLTGEKLAAAQCEVKYTHNTKAYSESTEYYEKTGEDTYVAATPTAEQVNADKTAAAADQKYFLKSVTYRQFTKQFAQNSLATVTGKVLTNPSSTTKGARFTFDIQVGTEKMEVAYDYHVDKNSGSVENALRAVAKKGDTITIKGTLRFSHGQDKTLIPVTNQKGTGGQWSIVPFLAAHMPQ